MDDDYWNKIVAHNVRLHERDMQNEKKRIFDMKRQMKEDLEKQIMQQ